jgi:uncharacterized membrane protein
VGSSNVALGIFWFVCLLLAASALDSLFSSRAAYLHVGAMIGTAMVANVFLIIIPNQRKVVADLIAGRTPDPALGAAAKQRSLHNNYMTLPVLFIMISPHYPMTYGAQRPWLVLALLGLTGVAVRHVFNLRGRGKATGPTIAVAAALAFATVTYVTLEKKGASGPAEKLTFAEVEPMLATHCAGCHNVPAPPLGVKLDSWEHVKRRVGADQGDGGRFPGDAAGQSDRNDPGRAAEARRLDRRGEPEMIRFLLDGET